MVLNQIVLLIKQKVGACFLHEKENLFSFLIVAFILGLILAEKLLEVNNFIVPNVQIIILISILVFFLLLLICLLIVKIKWLIILDVLLIFVALGFSAVTFKALCKNNAMLNNNLRFAHLTGKVVNTIPSNDNKFNIIFLKDVKFINYNNLSLPNNLKLTTFYKDLPKKGSIISVWANLKAFYAFTPYSNGLQANSFWHNIGATGYILSRIKVISSIHQKGYNAFEVLINNTISFISNKINKNFSSRVAGIANAVTLGTYGHINKQDMLNLTNSGLLPFISISGFHIAVITSFIFIFVRLSLALVPIISLNINTKKIASVITIVVLVFYMILLKDVPPALRSGLMAILFMMGVIFNFQTFSTRNLLFACFCILIFKPEYIASISFLLSFIATAAVIMLFNNKTIKSLCHNSKSSLLKTLKCFIIINCLLSVLVNITLLPIIAQFFNSFPTYSVISNLLVTPLFSIFIMPFLLLGLLLPQVVAVYAFKIVQVSIDFMLQIASIISSLKFSNTYFANFSNYILIIYIISILIVFISKSKIKYLGVIVCLTIIIYIFLNPYPIVMIDKSLKVVSFFDSKSKTYVFNNLKEASFIKKIWVNDLSKISPKNLKNSKSFYCDKYNNCIVNYNNIIISYNNDNSYIQEACLEANLIIFNGYTNFKCNNAFIIDKFFMKKYGSTFIYFTKSNTIKLVSEKNSRVIKIVH